MFLLKFRRAYQNHQWFAYSSFSSTLKAKGLILGCMMLKDTKDIHYYRKTMKKYTKQRPLLSAFDIAITLILLFGLFTILYLTSFSWWTAIAIFFTSAALSRVLNIQHELGHGSRFKSSKLSNALGLIFSTMTLLPYYYWRKNHALHHGYLSELINSHVGNLQLMSVEQYNQASWLRKLYYKLFRNTLVLVLLIPSYYFLIQVQFVNRFDKRCEQYTTRDINSIRWSKYVFLLMFVGVFLFLGPTFFLTTILPVYALYFTLAVTLFYTQHNFNDVYFSNEKTDSLLSALQGSSYLRAGPIFNWFTCYCGGHHIHHLNSRIPSYNLLKAHNENKQLFKTVPVLTLFSWYKCFGCKLYDEKNQKMIGWREYRRLSKQAVSE